MMNKDRIEALLNKGVIEGVYPGAVLLVAFKGEILLFQHVGSRTLFPKIFPMERDTIFDLASLTKPLATTLAVMKLIDSAKIDDDNKYMHYDRMRVWQDALQQYEQSPSPDWSKDFVTDFSIHIKADESRDDELFEIYQTFLEAYLDMAKNARPLAAEQRDKLKEGMETYVDSLLDKGGPAVDVFEKFLGPEKQREYVRTVMFGLDP